MKCYKNSDQKENSTSTDEVIDGIIINVKINGKWYCKVLDNWRDEALQK